ncbi:hypothetical protein ASD15_27845 [Massilia sp. Root351]|nr:hypothetical protein ASD15_27845 [Massilia sp. Root351]
MPRDAVRGATRQLKVNVIYDLIISVIRKIKWIYMMRCRIMIPVSSILLQEIRFSPLPQRAFFLVHRGPGLAGVAPAAPEFYRIAMPLCYH